MSSQCVFYTVVVVGAIFVQDTKVALNESKPRFNPICFDLFS
jgi:hypothetical protein